MDFTLRDGLALVEVGGVERLPLLPDLHVELLGADHLRVGYYYYE